MILRALCETTPIFTLQYPFLSCPQADTLKRPRTANFLSLKGKRSPKKLPAVFVDKGVIEPPEAVVADLFSHRLTASDGRGQAERNKLLRVVNQSDTHLQLVGARVIRCRRRFQVHVTRPDVDRFISGKFRRLVRGADQLEIDPERLGAALGLWCQNR